MIFKDKAKLSPHYIPEVLPHRLEQIELLNSIFRDSLRKPSEARLRVVQIIGPVGTGKTCTVIRFGQRFEDDAHKLSVKLKHLYINLKLHGGSRVLLYRYLVQRAAPPVFSTSLSAEELLYQLLTYLQGESEHLLITLDEIDYFLRQLKESRVIYDLTRLDEMVQPGEPCGVMGLIVTARSREFHIHLDRAEVSSLGRLPIEFKPYTEEQIYSILQQRVDEAFQPGAIPSRVLEYVADITAGPVAGGDIRYALDLLLFSGELAEREKVDKVSLEQIRRVVGETHPSITSEDVVNLSEKSRMVLLAIVRALKTKRVPYVSLRDIRSAYGVLCEEYSAKPMVEIEEYIQDLQYRGLIDIKSLTEVGISSVPTEVLDRFLDGLIRRVGESLASK